MKNRIRRMALSLVLSIALLVSFAAPALAANPTVAITVTAEVIAITNTQATWDIGTVALDAVVYFSTDGVQDDDWSAIENTGSVVVDVAIQGTDIAGTTYDWTLSTAAGSEAYSLYANDDDTPTVYDIEVKSSVYSDLATSFAVDDTKAWSMEFTAPSAFNAGDTGDEKSATITLVASASA